MANDDFDADGTAKQNGRCQMAMAQGKCEDMGCEWHITDDSEDGEVTTMTTSTPSTTSEEVGCCKGDDAKSNEVCWRG